MPSDELAYEFCDLPLIVRNDQEFGHVNGKADIEYWHDGSWVITAIYLEGTRPATDEERRLSLVNRGYESSYTSIYAEIDAGDPAYYAIFDRLENHHREKIDDLVEESRFERCQYERERAAEERMEDRRLGRT